MTSKMKRFHAANQSNAKQRKRNDASNTQRSSRHLQHCSYRCSQHATCTTTKIMIFDGTTSLRTWCDNTSKLNWRNRKASKTMTAEARNDSNLKHIKKDLRSPLAKKKGFYIGAGWTSQEYIKSFSPSKTWGVFLQDDPSCFCGAKCQKTLAVAEGFWQRAFSRRAF